MILARASLSLWAFLQGEPQYFFPLASLVTTSRGALVISITPDASSSSSSSSDSSLEALTSYKQATINDEIVRLQACEPNTNCVSSNYREPPNRYVSPFKIVRDPETAFQRAVRDLIIQQSTSEDDKSGFSVAEIIPNSKYIHLTVPGTAPSSLDDIDIVFSDSVANVKCQARVTLPPPPFCVRKNCINGNMDQRSRIEKLGYILGLPPSDREEMQTAKWTPIFFNSDRVPGFDDEF
ncbi:unnamed protein product [Cylindrotheca closterium]|uniref:Uncharacterized protein n=1 Tax=Cylindrotheca closterium TaxID=2856 RepID=A0AAD2GEE1_9STRA|nr:unnamed protein product [Cylindrotheca closterium]